MQSTKYGTQHMCDSKHREQNRDSIDTIQNTGSELEMPQNAHTALDTLVSNRDRTVDTWIKDTQQ